MLLFSAIVGVGAAVIAWKIRFFVRVRRRDRKALQLMKAVDKALGPIMKDLENGILEIGRCVMIVMTALANATAPPLDWLFESSGGDAVSSRSGAE